MNDSGEINVDDQSQPLHNPDTKPELPAFAAHAKEGNMSLQQSIDPSSKNQTIDHEKENGTQV